MAAQALAIGSITPREEQAGQPRCTSSRMMGVSCRKPHMIAALIFIVAGSAVLFFTIVNRTGNPPKGKDAGLAGSCPKCHGKYNCDEWIAWDPSRYSCSELERDYGCDCSGCSECGGIPNAATKVLFDEAQHPDARCLDGSMAGYYLRHGTEDKYIMYLEGGGWCYDQDCGRGGAAGTIKDCKDRSWTAKGSSRRWADKQDSYTGMLSADPRENPVFHNWTMVYVPYCDGTSFSGDAYVDGLYFKGKAVLQAVIEELQATSEIGQAQQVVVAGGSAGASAVYYHVDSIAELLDLKGGEVVGLPDAGFFLDLKDKDGINCWPSQMRSVFDLAKGYGSLHKGCLARYHNETWRCLFPEYYVDLIKARMFALNSLYDSSETSYTLRLECCPGHTNCYDGYPTCDEKDEALFEAMRGEHLKAWAPMLKKSGNGIWAPACIAHTMAWGKWTDQTWEVPAHSGNTMAAVVQRWLENKNSGGGNLTYQDDVAWPDNLPCASADMQQAASLQL